jgi:hypothetical protein
MGYQFSLFHQPEGYCAFTTTQSAVIIS